MHMAAKRESNIKKWEHPKKSGIWIRELIYTKKLQSKIGKDKEGTYSAFQVTIPSDKDLKRVRQRKQFTTKAKAEKWASETALGLKKASDLFGETTANERNEFLLCHEKLKDHGITLTEAVEFALKRLKPKGGERSVSEIAQELIESKRMRFKRGDLRERSFRDFNHRASKFGDAFDQMPSYELTAQDLKDWLIGLEVTPRTTQNYLSVVGEVLKYAAQKKYIPASPLDDLTDNDRKELCGSGNDESEPSTLSIDKCSKLLEAAYEHSELGLLGAVTIGLFCGVRIEELKRLTWENVKDSESSPVITISSSMAKKRRIRHVDIPENALIWLSLCTERTGTVAENKHTNDYQKRFRKLLQLAGFGHTDDTGKWVSNWETNAMRHSFGSYHYALHGNPLETSRQLGHKASDQVLFDHYRALATKEQGKAFFSIEPPKSQSKLVEFAG